MKWLTHATLIWGDRWVAPMARALDLNPRTVQRWKATALGGEPGAHCPAGVQLALHNMVSELYFLRTRRGSRSGRSSEHARPGG